MVVSVTPLLLAPPFLPEKATQGGEYGSPGTWSWRSGQPDLVPVAAAAPVPPVVVPPVVVPPVVAAAPSVPTAPPSPVGVWDPTPAELLLPVLATASSSWTF